MKATVGRVGSIKARRTGRRKVGSIPAALLGRIALTIHNIIVWWMVPTLNYNLKTEDTMKTEDLKEKGFTDEQIKLIFAENGKDIKALQDEVKNLTAERDKWRGQAEAAENTLKGFEGKDFDKMTEEVNKWKKAAEESEANYAKKIAERDFNDALTAEISKMKFTSEAAKKAVVADIKAANLTMKDGKILGLGDLIEQIKTTDASAFVDEKQEELEQGKAKFTGGMGAPGAGSTMTKEDIMKIKDSVERQNAIKAHMDLFAN